MDKTAAKAFRVLERLTASERPIGVSALARELRLPKSNVHRVLSTLVELGYAQPGTDGGYQPTLRTWEIGVRVLNRVSVQRIAAPLLEELAFASGETVHLALRDGTEAVYVAIIESMRAVRTFTRIGQRVPLHCTAVGKILIAFARDPVELGRLERHSPATITDTARLRQELERIRKQGYAVNLGEWNADVFGIAAPVLDHRGEVVGAVALSGPSERLKPAALKRAAPQVQATARRISTALGWRSF